MKGDNSNTIPPAWKIALRDPPPQISTCYYTMFVIKLSMHNPGAIPLPLHGISYLIDYLKYKLTYLNG